MGFTKDVLTAAAEDLAAAGIGAVWNPTGVYKATELGIFTKVMPASPDRAIVLTVYPVTVSHLSDTTLGLQVRCRMPGLPTDVDDLADAIYEHWHGRQGLTLGPAHVALMMRQSHAQMGRDANNRSETSSNFYLTTAQASHAVTD